MANQEQLEILKQGHTIWNKWFKQNLARGLPDLTEASLSDTDLSSSDLRGVNLKKAILIRANLGSANLSGANLSESFLYRATLKEAEARGASLNGADISEADLQGAVLSNSYFIGTTLTRANLNQAQVIESDFRGADLRGTDLRGADLTGASFAGADLSRADLREADCSRADFERTNLGKAFLAGAKFSNVHLYSTIFGSNDLSQVTGLEKAIHDGPSILNIETIYNSKGKIPEGFLRGCGLSDLQIETAKLAAPGLDPKQVTDINNKIQLLYLGNGIQSYSCFISYSTKDEEFAKRLHDDLQNNGVRCWLGSEEMKTGDKFRTRIDDAIRVNDKLLMVLSENSVDREWVEKEVKAAFEKEHKDHHTVLYPIRLDESLLNADQPWADDIRHMSHVGDFSKKDNYQKALERLLRDLKATGAEA